MDYLGGPTVITKVWINRQGRQKSENQRDSGVTLLALKMEERGQEPRTGGGL